MKKTIASSVGGCLGFAAMLGLSIHVRADDNTPAAPINPATVQELPEVTVVGTTPLPGLGTPLNLVPANVQTATSKDIDKQKTLDLADYMNQNLNGVFINETQDNPFQPDVNFRGYTASPLLGAPEGLSVYVDGVRVNESFGDVVNWDLIPESAIANITLMPGSNPLFGLNTLGGALSVQTKSGAQYPGTSISAYGGSFGRRNAQFETGGSKGNFDYFLTGNWFDEDGWRPSSPSHVRQLFGKAGWQNETTDVDLSYAYADTNLTGNGLTPEDMIASLGRKAVFTAPDNTKNHLNFLNARASHFLRSDLLLAGNVYFRQLATRTFNGDVNDDYSNDYGVSVAPGGDCATAPDPDACAAAEFSGETGVNHSTDVNQRTYGGTVQLTYSGDIFARKNQLSVGVSYDKGRSDFTQTEQDAAITPSRSTIADGDVDEDVSLYGSNRNYGVFATDTFSLNQLIHFTASARYNDTRVTLEDRLGTDLNGDHGFRRINPSFGINLTPDKDLTVYLDYNEGSRAPTAIELGCADPTQPCKLPNAFAADPALKQVVAKTWEFGARGKVFGKLLGWSAAVYHTSNNNDIQFISSELSGAGYFDNVGRTRRQGVELGLSGEVAKRFHWHTGYSFIDATYRTPLSLISENNSTANADGFISVTPGDRLPLVPRHTGKLEADYDVTAQWNVGANLIASSGQFVRGNENNLHQQGVNGDGETFQHSGRIGGYAVLNLNSSYRFGRHWEIFGRINNLFDRDYATSGQLTSNPFDSSGHFVTNPANWPNVTAISPSMPRAYWAGMRLSFD